MRKGRRTNGMRMRSPSVKEEGEEGEEEEEEE